MAHLYFLILSSHIHLLSKDTMEFKKTTFPIKLINTYSWIKESSEVACVSHSFVSDTLRPHGPQSTRLLCPWNSLGKNIGVHCHSLLQGIFLTQGSNPSLLCLLHWQPGGPPGKPPASLRSSQIPGNEVGMRDIAWKEKSELGNVPGHPGARGRYGAMLCGLFVCFCVFKSNFFFLFCLHWSLLLHLSFL